VARRAPASTEVLADDLGAEEQRQGRFAQAPAEEPAPVLGKAGRGGSGIGGAKREALDQASGTASRSREASKQKKAAPSSPSGRAERSASPKADGAGFNELAADAESGFGVGAGNSASGTAPGASGGAAGPPAQAPRPQPAPSQPAPAQPAPSKSAPARKPSAAPAVPPPPAAERAPASRDEDEADEAPADRKAGAARSSERERKDDRAARVVTLHQQALAAAARGDCATVRTTSNTIRGLDATYHRDRVVRDKRLQECLAVQQKK
jgi:hypothetical protein